MNFGLLFTVSLDEICLELKLLDLFGWERGVGVICGALTIFAGLVESSLLVFSNGIVKSSIMSSSGTFSGCDISPSLRLLVILWHLEP